MVIIEEALPSSPRHYEPPSSTSSRCDIEETQQSKEAQLKRDIATDIYTIIMGICIVVNNLVIAMGVDSKGIFSSMGNNRKIKPARDLQGVTGCSIHQKIELFGTILMGQKSTPRDYSVKSYDHAQQRQLPAAQYRPHLAQWAIRIAKPHQKLNLLLRKALISFKTGDNNRHGPQRKEATRLHIAILPPVKSMATHFNPGPQ